MTYDELKAKYPNFNWREAEEVSNEDLEAAANLFDKLVIPEAELDWCKCGKNEDAYFVPDGQDVRCMKHHWKCNNCGQLVQVG